MRTEDIVLILLLIIALAVLFGLIISRIVKKCIRSYILNHSTAIAAIIEFNKTYRANFIAVERKFRYTKFCKSKSEYNRTNFDQLLRCFFSEDEDFFRKTIKEVEHNQKAYALYTEKCKAIFANRSTEWYGHFDWFEEEWSLFRQNELKPTVDLDITIYSKYTSPKGQNSYCNYRVYNLDDLKRAIHETEQQTEYQKSKEYQRMKMTDSLRYDVMKRDGFRCVLCGASAKNGAVLHVDHIFPVSKGGRTELSNLRTLCDQCNLGKRDKYDDNGIN